MKTLKVFSFLWIGMFAVAAFAPVAARSQSVRPDNENIADFVYKADQRFYQMCMSGDAMACSKRSMLWGKVRQINYLLYACNMGIVASCNGYYNEIDHVRREFEIDSVEKDFRAPVLPASNDVKIVEKNDGFARQESAMIYLIVASVFIIVLLRLKWLLSPSGVIYQQQKRYNKTKQRIDKIGMLQRSAMTQRALAKNSSEMLSIVLKELRRRRMDISQNVFGRAASIAKRSSSDGDLSALANLYDIMMQTEPQGINEALMRFCDDYQQNGIGNQH